MSVGRAVRGDFPGLGQASLVSARFPRSRSGRPNLGLAHTSTLAPRLEGGYVR